MDKESIRQNLLACDYDEYLHDEIFKLFENNQITRIRFLLQNHRDTLLNELHNKQNQIDALDYLLYKIQEKDGK